MSTSEFFTSSWTWNPALIAVCAAALAGYFLAFRNAGRARFFVAALAVVLVTLISPLNALADGYLFSAHMAQHILLLLIAPALLLLSLPRDFALPKFLQTLANPLLGWICGIGAMWFWHAPALCNAAVTSKPVYVVQGISLLVLGLAFWWQVLAPRESQRLAPLPAIIYLFSACTACTALGIIVTFSPVSICSIYVHPADRLGLLDTIRNGWGISPQRDQQIGGLLMWVPMCLVYLSAIFMQIARWYGAPAPELVAVSTEKL